MRHDDVTREIKIPTNAELLSEIGGELPNHGHTSYDERCDLAATQRLPAIPDTRPASQWSADALARLLDDVLAVRP